ncbi:hypothetical protein NM688_g1673 [Phlebia brevispora]|uniref:Uncharacterized protein n=1 Tax=Phlebia brevispora TaxID=194682 RepID=A0ACC1TAM8_9APHY|nr:hypothetical protein NM688_g1673 [Phlebia brevispora]
MYNSSSFRRPQTTAEAAPEKYRNEVQQLKELFETWSNEDLQSVLIETSGDVELAAARISEGQSAGYDLRITVTHT